MQTLGISRWRPDPQRPSKAATLVGLIIIVVLLVLTVRRTREPFSRAG
jgi:hypothetical protein